MERLRVHSIFESISGEAGGPGFPQGTWCTFIRLQGCNLSCSWCDTTPSQEQGIGQEMTVQEIIKACGNQQYILITGGEPLVQRGLAALVEGLLRRGKQVQIETNGSLAPFSYYKNWGSPIYWVMDYKCPSSGMTEEMPDIPTLFERIHSIRVVGDFLCIKWVIADDGDLDFALDKIESLIYGYGEWAFTGHLISPLNGDGNRVIEIVNRIKQRDGNLLNYITFSIQLHKLFGLP